MIIDIVKLKSEGKLSAQFDFNYQPPERIVNLPNSSISGGVAVNADVEIEGNRADCFITIKYTLTGECSRCLDEAHAEIVYEFGALYDNRPTDDEDVRMYKSGKVDLTEAVNEAIILSQPSVIYCKENCKGLCTVCGCNLNYMSCNHNKD